jgi:hypothetical protein
MNQEVGWGGMDWIDLAQDRDGCQSLFSAILNLRFPQNAGNFLTNYGTNSFSGTTLIHGVG